jgi:hypothetical protein
MRSERRQTHVSLDRLMVHMFVSCSMYGHMSVDAWIQHASRLLASPPVCGLTCFAR